MTDNPAAPVEDDESVDEELPPSDGERDIGYPDESEFGGVE